MSHTPLPHLHDQLVAAARALDAATAPRRRPRRRWAALGVIVALSGTGVAVARVAEIGPFAYLDRFSEHMPNLAPQSIITVSAGGLEPSWQAQAWVNKLGQLCVTGGPRDPRTNPEARPTSGNLNNPPATGLTCGNSEEVAEDIADPERPGATLPAGTALDGSQVNRERSYQTHTTGAGRPPKPDPPTRMLVYALADIDGPTPVVRFGPHGKPHAMIRSQATLTLPVNHSPRGLSPAEQRTLARLPRSLTLVLWAAEVPLPPRTPWAEVAYPSETPPHGADDATIELLTGDDRRRLDNRIRRTGWRPRAHISRDPVPVTDAGPAGRRWVAAFGRPPGAEDVFRSEATAPGLAMNRAQPRAARRLTVAGKGITSPVWALPAGMPSEFASQPGDDDGLCLAGDPLVADAGCQLNVAYWRGPFAEAVACDRRLRAGHSLIWALTPPGATAVEVRGPGDRVERLQAAELVVVQRRAAQRPTELIWHRAGEHDLRATLNWKRADRACEIIDRAGRGSADSQGGMASARQPPPLKRATR